MKVARENPMREWFLILAGCIIFVGAIGFIPLAHIVIPYILYALGFLGLVFGIVIIPFPRRDFAQILVACILTTLLLVGAQQYGLF